MPELPPEFAIRYKKLHAPVDGRHPERSVFESGGAQKTFDLSGNPVTILEQPNQRIGIQYITREFVHGNGALFFSLTLARAFFEQRLERRGLARSGLEKPADFLNALQGERSQDEAPSFFAPGSGRALGKAELFPELGGDTTWPFKRTVGSRCDSLP